MIRLALAASAALTLSACGILGPSQGVQELRADFKAMDERFAASRAQENKRLDCLRKHRAELQIGMQRAELAATCWTFAAQSHRTQTAGHVHEQVVFEAWGERVYAYFDDGILTAVQD